MKLLLALLCSIQPPQAILWCDGSCLETTVELLGNCLVELPEVGLLVIRQMLREVIFLIGLQFIFQEHMFFVVSNVDLFRGP